MRGMWRTNFFPCGCRIPAWNPARGIAKVAKAAGIERESLYRALSRRGNPRLSTLVAVTKAIGLKLTVEAAR